ncbi:MAG TPA: nucleoside triphosphate pyrophosphohydrolase [Longimicrobiaceae bacterium]|nr:nucleoside triphosphate pyrophosphohydrolase [Longimicrobiaceae bacterium]
MLDHALLLVEFLRARCPWDAAQTPHSLQRHLLEESHEVSDAITLRDDAALADELGDLLLNLAFQIVLGEERGAFNRAQVVRGLTSKIARRHPHLFGQGDAEPWESIKRRERQGGDLDGGLLAELADGPDPLLRAQRIQERVARIGFDWPNAGGALDKVREEVEEVAAELAAGRAEALEEELGDVLFSVVNLARLTGAHASVSLARANAKFARRFAGLERLAAERGLVLEDAGLELLDQLWEEAKRGERELP